MTNPFGHNPFESNSFPSGPVGMPGPPPPRMPAPMRSRDETNVLATLSVVFAFVFAPVGAILGHLSLSQIRHTGEKGRDRALVGVTLSYVFITVAVVALIVGASLIDDSPTRVATPTSTTATSATPPPPPPPPTVAPTALEALLPSLDDAKNITGDHDLTVKQTYRQITRDPNNGSIDRPECWTVFDEGAPDGYNVPAIAGFFSIEYLDVHSATSTWQAEQGVAAFHDAAAAQAQLASLQSQWRQCGGSTLTATISGYTVKTAMSVPVDAGNGITTIDLTTLGLPLPVARAIAAKSNVVVDVLTSSSGADIDRVRQAALTITNSILAKIPG
jgi:hypothetical protein